jgi:2-keto-4-pentenoate hydratase/2-oxohepta-3-ene-1,7-dioic acid hydratase in catechol pathway
MRPRTPGTGHLTPLFVALWLAGAPLLAQDGVTRYVRYKQGDSVSFGILEGETIRQLRGDLFAGPTPTGRSVRLADVKLLAPVDPTRVNKVLGVAVNTRRPGREQPLPHPRWFAKLPTSLNDPEGDIELPPEAANLNYEGELVVVIGKRGRHIPAERALEYVFGYTVGNDVSENTWYGERQGTEEPTRLISKAADTWGALGPVLVRGLDYRGLRVVTRLNGEVVNEGTTNDLVNDVPNLISYISRYVTLLPGDVLYTGTYRYLPDKRRAFQAGDVVEVEIEKIGLLRNRVVAMKVPATP